MEYGFPWRQLPTPVQTIGTIIAGIFTTHILTNFLMTIALTMAAFLMIIMMTAGSATATIMIASTLADMTTVTAIIMAITTSTTVTYAITGRPKAIAAPPKYIKTTTTLSFSPTKTAHATSIKALINSPPIIVTAHSVTIRQSTPTLFPTIIGHFMDTNHHSNIPPMAGNKNA